MKIYTDVEDIIDPLEDTVNKMIEGIQPGHPFEATVPILKKFIQTLKEVNVLRLENAKHRLMWALRKLENEIDEEGGMLIINSDGKLEMKHFSPSLTERIKKDVQEHFK